MDIAAGGSQTDLGDVNSDGSITIVDTLLTAQYYMGLNPADFDQSKADTNCNSSIDLLDALLMAQYYVGLITGSSHRPVLCGFKPIEFRPGCRRREWG